ncbi:lipopolysaccharide biosynthesis protein [Streptomyces buecherae]|uniref:Lipopolysaccharide biosynthesis protein n=1 Tax=Streptomyces buecherae TaxID=2763006 RepID=A0A7H8NJX9_9ACTN|nr:lipopolysaccharide biosynthesis protein [Streptomyces buecherae]
MARRRAVRSRLPGWWPVALGAALGLAGGGTYGALATPEYTATSYVVAVAKDGTDPATALGFAQAYGRITTGGAVLGAAQRTTGTPVDDLRASVRTATSPDAPMIEVTGADARAGRAAATANAVARALAEHANRSERSTGVRLTVFARAVPPTAPTSPSLPISLAVGGCAGGLLGALALLVRPRPAPEPHQASTLDPLPTPGSEPR